MNVTVYVYVYLYIYVYLVYIIILFIALFVVLEIGNMEIFADLTLYACVYVDYLHLFNLARVGVYNVYIYSMRN